MNDRRQFLLEMYKQASAHLNRHILTTWQSVGVAATGLSVLIFGDKISADGPRFDFVVSMIIVLCAWMVSHIFDADNWFNRNLHLIANIERQFLLPNDAAEVHYFFTSHRLERSSRTRRLSQLILHFQVHFLLALAVALVVLGYHFYQRVLPGISLPLHDLQPIRAMPYAVAAICWRYCAYVSRKTEGDYAKLSQMSPGRIVR